MQESVAMSSPIEDLFKGERSVHMLAAYFDESGTDDQSSILSMGGYVGKANQWVEFERNWKELLARRSIECFHLTDYQSGWLKDKNGNRVTKDERLITQ